MVLLNDIKSYKKGDVIFSKKLLFLVASILTYLIRIANNALVIEFSRGRLNIQKWSYSRHGLHPELEVVYHVATYSWVLIISIIWSETAEGTGTYRARCLAGPRRSLLFGGLLAIAVLVVELYCIHHMQFWITGAVSFIGSMVVAISFNLSVRAVVRGRTSLFEEMRLLCCSCNRGVYESFTLNASTKPTEERKGGGRAGEQSSPPSPSPFQPHTLLTRGYPLELQECPIRDLDSVSRESITWSNHPVVIVTAAASARVFPSPSQQPSLPPPPPPPQEPPEALQSYVGSPANESLVSKEEVGKRGGGGGGGEGEEGEEEEKGKERGVKPETSKGQGRVAAAAAYGRKREQ